MKDFIEQAGKNGVTLFNNSNCQFCGAKYTKGVFDCIDDYSKGLALLDFNVIEYRYARFLYIDAHALQHPEIHPRWSSHFHLVRLNLIIARKMDWDFKLSPLLNDFLKEYKLRNPNNFLIVPPPHARGNRSAKDLLKSASAKESIGLIDKWANEVYFAWSLNHSIADRIAESFLAKMKTLNYNVQMQKTTNSNYEIE